MEDDPFSGMDDEDGGGSEALVWNLFSQIMIPIVILVTYVAVDGITRLGVFLENEKAISEYNAGKYAQCVTTQNASCNTELKQVYAQNQWDRLVLALERELRTQRRELGFDRFADPGAVHFEKTRIIDPDFQTFSANVEKYFGRNAPERVAFVRKLYDDALRASELRDDAISRPDLEIERAIAQPLRGNPEDFEVPATTSDQNRLIPQVRELFLGRIAAERNTLRDDAERVQIGVVGRIYHALQGAPEQQLTGRGRDSARRMLEPGISDQERKARAATFFRQFNDDLSRNLTDQGINFLPETWEALNAE